MSSCDHQALHPELFKVTGEEVRYVGGLAMVAREVEGNQEEYGKDRAWIMGSHESETTEEERFRTIPGLEPGEGWHGREKPRQDGSNMSILEAVLYFLVIPRGEDIDYE
jgi:hypothetical protein